MTLRGTVRSRGHGPERFGRKITWETARARV